MHGGHIHTVSCFERVDCRERLAKDRRVGRVSLQLRAQHFTKRLACGRNQDQPADIAGVSAGGERNEAALTMAEKPDARCAGFSTDHFHPGVKVDCIIINGNRICIGDSSSAVEHAALVDAHGDDALRGEPPGQKLVGRSLYTKRAVAIAVCGA